jgi:energy-coupling factor transport system ATP-binding protein
MAGPDFKSPDKAHKTDVMRSNPSGGSGDLAIFAHNLSFKYETSEGFALRGLDLEVPRSTTTAVLGASGAGKSTLCLSINGLIPKFVRGSLEGELSVLGRRVRDMEIRDMAGSVGVVLQDFEAQLFSTSAELEVAFGLENLGIEPELMRSTVEDALRTVGLEGYEKRDPSGLSGGEKQRLALAAVLAMEPELLVLDEPTSDLDPSGRRDVLRVVRDLAGRGRSVLLVEHETDELLGADQIVLLQNGRRVLSGTPEDVFLRANDGGHGPEFFGVRPPQLAELTKLLGLESLPLSVAAAEDAIRARGAAVEKSRAVSLRAGGGPSGGGRPLLAARNVRYSYKGGADAVHGVSLDIHEGEFVALIGPNGSGKTTLAKHFNGLLKPQEGTVEVAGADTRAASISELSRRVGYVFQNPDHQIFCETVADELAFGPGNAGLDRNSIAEGSSRALAAVGMGGCEDSDPFALTKGERQRVALASVLVMEPSVIVMDEPTTGLDYVQQKHVMDLLCELNRRGHTVIIITHSLWLAAQCARRTVILFGGTVVADGPTREVMSAREGVERWSLASPPAIALGRRLGVPALNVEELVYCLGGESAPGKGGLR